MNRGTVQMPENITQRLSECSNHFIRRVLCPGRLAQIDKTIVTNIKPNAVKKDMGGPLVIAEPILTWSRRL